MVTVDVSVSAVLSSEGEGCIIISNYIIYSRSYYIPLYLTARRRGSL